MIKNILTSLVVTLGVVAGVGLVHHNPFEKASPSPHELFQSSVQIANYCSGTVIDDPDLTDGIQTTILTAKHCVDKIDQKITVSIPEYVNDRETSKTDYEFTVVSISDESDLAILQTEVSDSWTIPPMKVYEGTTSFGDQVFAVAFPAGLAKTITEGFLGYIEKVPPFSDISKSDEFRRSSSMAAGGSSGGSLLKKTDDGYALVGVLTGGMQGFITYWTPLEEIQSYLKSVDIDGVKVNGDIKDLA